LYPFVVKKTLPLHHPSACRFHRR